MARSTFSGPISALTAETDGGIWIPAKSMSFYTGTWTDTRIAVGNSVMRKSRAAETPNIVANISAALLQKIGSDPNTEVAHDIRGIRIDSFDLVYGVGNAALTSATVVMNQVTYSNNVANAVAAAGGTLTGTISLATQTNPYVVNIACGTPYVICGNTADRAVTIEFAPVCAATTDLDIYGIYLRCSYNLL